MKICEPSGLPVGQCKAADLCDCHDWPEFDVVPNIRIACEVCGEVLDLPEAEEEFPAWIEAEAVPNNDEPAYVCWRHADDAQV